MSRIHLLHVVVITVPAGASARRYCIGNTSTLMR